MNNNALHHNIDPKIYKFVNNIRKKVKSKLI